MPANGKFILEDINMKLRNVIAAATAAVVGATLAISASAYDTFLMYASGDWSCSHMDLAACPDGNVDVTADGTYTVYTNGFTFEDEETGEDVPAVANGAMVFCVDIADLAADKGAGKGSDAYEALGSSATAAEKMAVAQAAGIEVSDVVITTSNSDGTTTDIAVDQSKILFGDIEGNGKIRIEIYNEYGDSKNDPSIDPTTISFDDAISVTFTISGVGEAAAETPADTEDTTAPADTTDTTAPAEDKGSPDTGVEGVAAVAGVAALAAGALIVSKKRK